jgi:hypothetical protein
MHRFTSKEFKNSSSFLDLFDNKWGPRLKTRQRSFRKIMELLEFKQQDFYTIVETGCYRGFTTADEGHSTLLFDDFINYYDGVVFTVDIDKEACEKCDDITSSKVKVHNGDSVEFLWNLSPMNIDLVYLDSYDIEMGNTETAHPSMLHHMKELCAIIGKLKTGTIILVDDNLNEQIGKGAYVNDFMKNLGYKKIVDEWQIGWIL